LAFVTKRSLEDGRDFWRAHIRIIRDGKIDYQETRSFHCQQNAEAWAAAREQELESPDQPQRANHWETTLAELLGAYLKDPGVRTSRAKQSHLKLLQTTPLAQTILASLDQSHIIEHVRDKIDAGADATAVNNDLIWLRTVARWAQPFDEYPISVEEIENALVYCRLSGYVARTRFRDRRPTADELWRLSEFFKSPQGKCNLPMQEIIWFAIHSARRLTEITRLLWSDNDYDHRTGLVRHPKHPGQQVAENQAFNYTTDAWEIIQRQPRTDLRIFPYDPESIGNAFTQACHRLAIHDLRFHDLRREAICRLFEAGTPVPEIQQVTLIHDLKTLGRYAHLNATDTPALRGIIVTTGK